MKPRILIVTDSAKISTGFGRVAREVGKRLYDTNKYEIAQHGWFHRQSDKDIPFQIFPTKKRNGIPIDEDKYGSQSFDDVVSTFMPDIVLGIGDPPWLECIPTSTLKHTFRTIFYSPVDGFPLPANWSLPLKFPNKMVLFGEWPKRLVKKQFDIDCETAIWHGVDCTLYRPPTKQEKLATKTKRLKNTDSFIFLYVGRNSERKRVDLILQAVSLIKYGQYGYCKRCVKYLPDPIDSIGVRVQARNCPICSGNLFRGKERDVKLLMHTPLKDVGPPIEKMVEAFNMHGHVYIDPNYKVAEGCSDQELVEYYWAADSYLSFATEGWGLPIGEAMACGLPIITGDYSMPPEFCSEASLLVPAQTWTMEQGGNHGDKAAYLLRPVPDFSVFIEKALSLIDNKELRDTLSTNGRKKALTMDWDIIAKQWEAVLDEQATLIPKKKGYLEI